MDHLIYLTPKQTERLIIRPLTWEDSEIWTTFLKDEVCTKYFPEVFTKEENAAELWIESQLKRYDEERFGLMALIEKDTNAFVGQCGLLHQEINGVDELEIGYHLFRQYHGKGFATEAAQFFKELGFYFTEVPSIISLIHPENKPSQAVAMRNGMTPDGKAVHKDEEAVIYRILRPKI
ncbi:MAG: GNAT family N-acetyltransferase [Salibacteraceae bacterium]|jgi:[ribosomal protein S5]-alanine N-acetyltransferase|nr:GNAT family N-acetyltransferase [Salibacteraceae bacterium]MDP4687414.1 GNAT family N-acetyltransferase [Salibacteraceae bacterium]MDP4845470.1 GNAT family N-acetyltransferase [Salibacteraceae bacterium]